MLDMQVIEALYLKDEEPHDYLHIKHEGTLMCRRNRGCCSSLLMLSGPYAGLATAKS